MDKKYEIAVKEIKEAILKAQYEAIKSINEKQLKLYYSIGKYISINSRKQKWGSNAIDIISERITTELPGLRGFNARNIRLMRTFYEEWNFIEEINVIDSYINNESLPIKDKPPIWNSRIQNLDRLFIEAFVSISFTHHRKIFEKVKQIDERIFYIELAYYNHLSVPQLTELINQNVYKHRGKLSNNFVSTIKDSKEAIKAITAFKDNYSLSFVNTEEIDVRDKEDIDERVLENRIVHNIKKFILTFGKDFCFIGNQYHLDAFGEDEYIDLLFYHRELRCLVAIELKTGKFKPAYLGQLSGYLDILDGFEKKDYENPSIGILLCKDINKSHVDYVLNGYNHPIGVATYKTTLNMPEELRKSLPSVEELIEILDGEDDEN